MLETAVHAEMHLGYDKHDADRAVPTGTDGLQISRIDTIGGREVNDTYLPTASSASHVRPVPRASDGASWRSVHFSRSKMRKKASS